MNKDKLKVSFEIDRYKVIGMLSRNCENAEEYNEIMGILEGKSEFVRDANGNEELASRICNYALDSILVENPDLALRKRLDNEQKELSKNSCNERWKWSLLRYKITRS